MAEQQRAEALRIADAQAAAAVRRSREFNSTMSTLTATLQQQLADFQRELATTRDEHSQALEAQSREHAALRQQHSERLADFQRQQREFLTINDTLRLEAANLREEFAQLHTNSRIQQHRMEGEREALLVDHDNLRGVHAALVGACDDILVGSAATWGPAHHHLRDLLARHRRPS